jgi:hypothetical protein
MSVNEDNPIRRMSRFTALLYYHLTKAIVDEWGDGAKEVIARGIRAFGLERGRNIAGLVSQAGLELTIENLDRFYDLPITQGWSPNAQYEGERKTSRTESCTFADVWKDKDWVEVGRLYCDVDPAIREGYNPDIAYTPTSNILEGDPFCSSTTAYRECAPGSEPGRKE